MNKLEGVGLATFLITSMFADSNNIAVLAIAGLGILIAIVGQAIRFKRG